jgi:hypothetical protein
MTGSIKHWFEVFAYTITITAVVAIAALAMRVGGESTITLSMVAAFFGVFAIVAMMKRERSPD